MKDTIIKYLTEEMGTAPELSESIYSKLERHLDILGEFENYLTKREYPDESNGAIVVNGYSARKLSETAKFLDPSGVYTYLVYLREKPEEALSDLQKGLPRK
jgi:hypothetical protein